MILRSLQTFIYLFIIIIIIVIIIFIIFNITVNWMALILRIEVALRSNFGPEIVCPHWGFSCSVLVPPANAGKVPLSRQLHFLISSAS
jgi:hypothetical protein